MTSPSRPLESEAFFGSAARRDGDGFSDLDYLIVGDDGGHIRGRKAWLQERGFSVADYTWVRLEKLSSAKTLFLIHLKLESRITIDTEGRLNSLLCCVQPKTNYCTDYRDSLVLFDPLRAVPNHPRGFAWAADALAVAFRNSAILQLASDGEFIFSMNKIITRLRARGLITGQQQEDLRSLRVWKAGYRSSVDFGLTEKQFARAASAVREALDHDFEVGLTNGAPIAEASSKSSTDVYAYMRSLEAELISLPRALVANPRVRELRTLLLQYLSDPHSYLWSFMSATSRVEGPLAELRARY